MPSLKSLCRLVAVVTLASSMVRGAEPESLDTTLEPYLKRFGLPALAAAVFKNGVIIASGKAGTRRFGENIPVMIDDRFHIGSDSKAFTSLLAGQFVEAGKLRWDSTLADVFPELKAKMNPDFAKITVEELLSHASGLSDKQLVDIIYRSYQQDGNMDEVRYWMVKEIAPKPLDHPRGSKFDYCNFGYIVAGAILERLGGKTWEELVEERIIEADGAENRWLWPASNSRESGCPARSRTCGWKAESDVGRAQRRQSGHHGARWHDAHVSTRFRQMGVLACRGG